MVSEMLRAGTMAFKRLVSQPCPHLEKPIFLLKVVPCSIFSLYRWSLWTKKLQWNLEKYLFFFFFRKILGCTYLPYSNSKLIPLPPHMLLVFPQLLPTEREPTLLSNSLKNIVILCHIFTTPSPIHLFSNHLFEHILYQVCNGNKDR